MEKLNILEITVLEMLLIGDHPILKSLRFQLESCTVKEREFTGVGFFTSLQIEKYETRIHKLNLALGDVFGEIDGLEHGASFVVFVEDGLLKTLEGASYDGPWPSKINVFNPKYMSHFGITSDGLRDLSLLSKVLEEAIKKLVP